MSRNDEWTKEEEGRLKRLYSTETEFEEIVQAIPSRTPNAIRMKASRLGLRRPISEMPSQPTMLICVEGNGRSKGYILRCGDCGNWVHIKESRHGICGVCGSACQVIL
jgi:hypothetical protein